MTKLSKTGWLIMGIGIFAILLASFGVVYSSQTHERVGLSDDLAQAQLILAKSAPEELSAQERRLESQLAQVKSQFEAARARLSRSVDGIEIADSLLDVADDCDVDVVGLESSAPEDKELEGVTYSVLPIKVTVGGDLPEDVPKLINFVLALDKEFPDAEVESVEINVPLPEEEEQEEEEEEEEPEEPSATIKLNFYIYKG